MFEMMHQWYLSGEQEMNIAWTRSKKAWPGSKLHTVLNEEDQLPNTPVIGVGRTKSKKVKASI